MQIHQAEYSGTYVDLARLPRENWAEIALVGRSNVGKSSLINRAVNRKNLAKSSSTPGKTRTINYYLINRKWYLVDLPGYGYAKVSAGERKQWGKMIEQYLSGRKQLRGVVQLLDIRRKPNADDILMKEWLRHFNIPILFVATKADKVPRSRRQENLKIIRGTLDFDAGLGPLIFSAQTGEGAEAIRDAWQALLDET